MLSAYSFTLLFQLIYPKTIFFKGSPSKEIFYQEVFNGLTSEESYKNVMYNEIERIQDKIDKMEASNKKRSAQYRRTLKISLLLVAISIFVIVRAIYT